MEEMIEKAMQLLNAVIVNETEYNALMETLYLLSASGMKERLEEAKKAEDKGYEAFEWWRSIQKSLKKIRIRLPLHTKF